MKEPIKIRLIFCSSCLDISSGLIDVSRLERIEIVLGVRINWFTGIKNTRKTIIPANIPYNRPLEGLLIFKIPVLYKKIPTTIPIEIAGNYMNKNSSCNRSKIIYTFRINT